ncbi:acyltransferase [Siphonobacter sp. SORGH_AS_0500]|uniref:acyltransferase family protein n=1 Tax=Siphonobacter sp. SORGH_AS_0500 TaxID=1864824 RepID=UPI0021014384|nr:acyltransferase [Siphonobacter sp. SORGH_AS_0500]
MENSRKNNFDFLRLVFAAGVIITHAYPLTASQECDWLCKMSHGQYSFSWIAVRGFFVISGYLIFQSLQRSRNLLDFYWKRVLRLYPALIVVLTLTIALGPLVYKGEIPYWKNEAVKTYFTNNLGLYRIQYAIPGIFEHNPHPFAINGSLWTIAFEFTMYIAVSAFFFIKNKRNLLIPILAVIYLILAKLDTVNFEEIQKWNYPILDWYLIELGVYFAAGSLLAVLGLERLPIAYLTGILLVSLSVFIYMTSRPGFLYASVSMLPLIVLCASLIPVKGVSTITKYIGDLSYGLYIYGFPVQQTLVYFFKPGANTLIISSLLVSAVFAYLSWHWIEKPALKLKNLSKFIGKKKPIAEQTSLH